MFINVADLLCKSKSRKIFSFDLSDNDLFEDNGEIKVFDGDFSGEVSILENVITLNGKLKINLSLLCSRCSETYESSLDISLNEEFDMNSDDSENSDCDDLSVLEGENINVKKLLEDDILFELPMKFLCSKDCKGLCQECGKNLNIDICNCKKEEIDPRLSKLKDFFK